MRLAPFDESASKNTKKSQQELKLDARQVSFGAIPLADPTVPASHVQPLQPAQHEETEHRLNESRRKLIRFRTKPDIKASDN